MWKNRKIRYSAAALKKSLGNHICGIIYWKKSGEQRFAIGTRNPIYIPDSAKPKGVKRVNHTGISYYDLEKKSWRGLSRGNLLCFWEAAEITVEGVLFDEGKLLTDLATVLEDFEEEVRHE